MWKVSRMQSISVPFVWYHGRLWARSLTHPPTPLPLASKLFSQVSCIKSLLCRAFIFAKNISISHFLSSTACAISPTLAIYMNTHSRAHLHIHNSLGFAYFCTQIRNQGCLPSPSSRFSTHSLPIHPFVHVYVHWLDSNAGRVNNLNWWHLADTTVCVCEKAYVCRHLPLQLRMYHDEVCGSEKMNMGSRYADEICMYVRVYANEASSTKRGKYCCVSTTTRFVFACGRITRRLPFRREKIGKRVFVVLYFCVTINADACPVCLCVCMLKFPKFRWLFPWGVK